MVLWSPLCFTPPTLGCVRSGPFRSARYLTASATSSMVGAHTNNRAAGPLLEKNCFLYGWQLSLVLTALTSPIEYQRNHVGPSGGSCTPSVGAPSGGSIGSTVPHGVGGGIQGNAIPSGPQGGSRRPSRIPQPSRLPQPLRHHPGAEAEGPSKMSGIKHLSVFYTSDFLG